MNNLKSFIPPVVNEYRRHLSYELQTPTENTTVVYRGAYNTPYPTHIDLVDLHLHRQPADVILEMSHCRRQTSSVTEGTDDRTDEHHGDQGDRVVIMGLPHGVVRETTKDIKEREGSVSLMDYRENHLSVGS